MAVLEIERHFKQDQQTVFEAWAQREKLEQWWGPKGFDTKAKEFQFAEGGVFHYSFAQQGAPANWGKFIFYTIQPPHTIQFSNSFSDEEGSLTPAPFPGAWPLQIHNTINFEEVSDGAVMTLNSQPMNATLEEEETFKANLDNMRLGFGGTFDRLETFLVTQS